MCRCTLYCLSCSSRRRRASCRIFSSFSISTDGSFEATIKTQSINAQKLLLHKNRQVKSSDIVNQAVLDWMQQAIDYLRKQQLINPETCLFDNAVSRDGNWQLVPLLKNTRTCRVIFLQLWWWWASILFVNSINILLQLTVLCKSLFGWFICFPTMASHKKLNSKYGSK